MENEDYVSLEVAKLLKDKGFNEDCNRAYYIEDPDIAPLFHGSFSNYGELYIPGYVAAPTLYEAQKWLREKHTIHVVVSSHYSRIYDVIEYEYRIATYFDFLEKPLKWRKSKEYYEEYEQCLNAGILEALKLI